MTVLTLATYFPPKSSQIQEEVIEIGLCFGHRESGQDNNLRCLILR